MCIQHEGTIVVIMKDQVPKTTTITTFSDITSLGLECALRDHKQT